MSKGPRLPVRNSFFILQVNFLISLVAVVGSLFFSDVLHFPPCTLCWYQRIFLFPLLFVFGTALWTADRNYLKYAMPMILGGLSVSIYHNLLYYGVVSEALSPCSEDLSCASKQLELFGFITIPLLAMLSFIALAGLTILDKYSEGHSNEK